MIKVTALTSGRHFPSSRFRVRQFIEPLRALGIDVSEHYPLINKYYTKRLSPLGMLARLPGVMASRSSAVTWFERELVPGRFTLERYAGNKRLVDIDDALWLNAPHFSERLAQLCDGVIAGNEFIAEHYRQRGARVCTVPTSIDTAIWRPAESRPRAEWTIGWTGTSSNLKYLYLIAEPLADFLAQHREARLLIVCDRKPLLAKLPADSWRFARWSPANEVALVQSLDVGLMPLPDTEWTRGKCALKLIMYMAVGIPAVISPVGVGREILEQHEVGLAARSTNEWYEALRLLFHDRETAARVGANGRKLVEKEFSVDINVPKIAAVIREIAD
jgi:glycosyltransferase involved in cell wall biosynthesis